MTANSSSTRNERRPRLKRDNAQALSVSDPSTECTSQKQENEEIAITSIRARDVALGLRRIPAGFYTAVQHSDLEWRTENKRVSMNEDVVEWGGPIPIPSDLSAAICIGIYGSFEFQPILGDGELLRQLTITVEQLLDCSANAIPFTFLAKDGDVVSPCSSILVTVARWNRESNNPVLWTLDPHRSTTECRTQLEVATDQGHDALSRYRKHGERRDLERSIEQFERVLDICPIDHPCRAAAQSNMGMARFILYRVDANVSLDVPLGLYRDALSARPVGHPDRPSTLIQLASVHSARFEKRREEADAGLAVAFSREAVDLSSADSHEKQVATLILQLHTTLRIGPIKAGGDSAVQQDSPGSSADHDLWIRGDELSDRFARFGDLDDLEQEVSLMEASINSMSTSHWQYPSRLESYSFALFYRYEQLGELGDLERAISMHGMAADLIPDDNPEKSRRLSNLGIFFLTRFERLGKLNDLARAISVLTNAVRLTPDSHSDKPAHLTNLGNSFSTRFECFGELSDLERAISMQGDAVDRTPDGHPDKPGYLTNFGNSLHARFERSGELSDLEQAISVQRDAVGLTSDGHLAKPRYLSNLGVVLEARFKRLGELSDLEHAISILGEAVELTPDGDPRRPTLLNNLGTCLKARFERLGELNDLERAVSIQGDAVRLTSDDHPDKSDWINNLSICLKARFERLGELTDLERAISIQKNVVALTSDGHPDKPGRLTNLGNFFFARFDHLGELSDLEQAILIQGDAVDLIPDGHPGKPAGLNNLGISLRARSERLGEFRDLERAISIHVDAVDLTPDDHPDKPAWLDNLGACCLIRYDHLGELSDLERAISMQRHALNLVPDDHFAKPTWLNNLGASLRSRFNHTGELSDLEQAIVMQGDAVAITPDGHSLKPCHLNNLSIYLRARFERLREFSDLEQAIFTQGVAVDLTPDGHSDKPTRLNNLSISFLTRFESLRELSDLERAISVQRDAVGLTPDGHPSKPGLLDNLGVSLRARFEHLKELSDIEQAIVMQGAAVDLTPDCHPDKPTRLNNLSISFLSRFKHFEEFIDLEKAISRQSDAVDLTPEGHADRLYRLTNLGMCLRVRFNHLGKLSDLERAISLHYQVASTSTGSAFLRVRASLRWISCARAVGHHSLLHAYSIAIGLLPQLAWIGLSFTNRYLELLQAVGVVREAAAAALDSGLPETAVEWLEQGRSIVWGGLLQLRSSYEKLLAAHPDQACRLQQLSVALEQASFSHEMSLSSFSEPTLGESLGQETNRHQALAIERDKLLQEIRGLPGFERFLLHKEFSQLRDSAHPGPVVILNAAESRCDALIVLADVENVIHVPLPKFDLERSANLQTLLQSLVRQARNLPLDERKGRYVPQGYGGQWEAILSSLWKCVVKPVLDSLAVVTPGKQSRIFWCPTGPLAFLPIHGAGFYDDQHSLPGHKLFDFVVSSYVPTLSILTPSPQPDSSFDDDLRVLTVRQPPSDGLRPLPGVDAELEHIRAVIRNAPFARTTLLESSIGTVEEVLELLKDADWIHFACHGIQDITNPPKSGLCLANERRLTL